MQCNAIDSKQADAASAGETNKQPSHAPQFTKVLDGRKHPIRGLWRTKTGRYYAQLRFEDSTTGEVKTRRVLLLDKDTKQPVTTVAQAVAEMARLRTNRADGNVPVLKRTPLFKEYADHYLELMKAGDGMKKPGTLIKEESTLEELKKLIGGVHLNKIRPFHVTQFQKRRLDAGARNRTVNSNLVVLRNVLRLAKTEGLLKVLPTAGVPSLKCTVARRPLFTAADLDQLCNAAFETKAGEDGEQVQARKNAQEFVDYIRLLAYSGAREQEAVALRWADVDFDRGQLTIGASGDTKNRTTRTVDFNPKLKAHLEDMATRRAPDSQWLFPSPQRGDKDVHVRTFRASLILVRRQAGMEHKAEPADGARQTIRRDRHGIAFHDLRHHFISYCVMSGIDYMTIASWVGHRDGGVLIGKVYGHLADDHKKAMAEKLNFGPAIFEAQAAEGGK